MEVELLGTKRAALFISDLEDPLSPRTLEKWRWAGTGPRFIRVGGRVYYRLSDLEDWLRSQTRASTSDKGADTADGCKTSRQRKALGPVQSEEGNRGCACGEKLQP